MEIAFELLLTSQDVTEGLTRAIAFEGYAVVGFAAQMQPLQVRHPTTSLHTGLKRHSTAKVGVSSSRSLD